MNILQNNYKLFYITHSLQPNLIHKPNEVLSIVLWIFCASANGSCKNWDYLAINENWAKWSGLILLYGKGQIFISQLQNWALRILITWKSNFFGGWTKGQKSCSYFSTQYVLHFSALFVVSLGLLRKARNLAFKRYSHTYASCGSLSATSRTRRWLLLVQVEYLPRCEASSSSVVFSQIHF